MRLDQDLRFDDTPMSRGDFERSYQTLRTEAASVRLPDERVLVFRGEDRLTWLQGQATQDLGNLSPGGAASFCLCKPTGQLLSVGRLAVLADRIVAVVPASTVPDVLQRVEDAVFIEDVSVETLDSHDVWTVQGPASLAALPRFADVEAAQLGEAAAVRHRRTGDQGFDLVVAKGSTLESAGLAPSLPESDFEAYLVARLEAGMPVWGLDMDQRTLPPEMGEQFELEHVAYGKGCYTGQEVVMRIHSRGHANRKWVGLIADAELHAGDTIPGTGAVTSAGRSPKLGFVAGAMLRTEAAKEGEIVNVITPTATVRAEVRLMPLLRPA